MNFLKKKYKNAKNVVQGKRNKDDDDDDFDNYVPEVPPHPSTLNDCTGGPGTGLNENLFPSVLQSTLGSITSAADLAAKSIAGIASSVVNPDNDATDNNSQLTLDQLKAREEEHKQKEKEKIKQQEESKKDNEDWKFFLSLTAKVEAVTSKTQSALNKLKDESAVNEISKIEDPCFSDQFDVIAPKGAGGWIAFEEQQQFNPADPIFNPKEPEPTKAEPEPLPVPKVVDEKTLSLARELIDDFGFTTVAPGLANSKVTSFLDSPKQDIDPFDTSFIDIEALKNGQSVSCPKLLHNLDFSEAELDPFDTSHVEAAITQDLVVNDIQEDVKVSQTSASE